MERITISEIQAIRETEIELGIDFWVGEFGAFDNVNHEDRIAYYTALSLIHIFLEESQASLPLPRQVL